jgi:hypothetical protein
MLQKRSFTEDEVLHNLRRLGSLGRSPIWTADDFAEADWKARAQGLVAGFAVGSVAVGVLLYLHNSK